MADPLLSVQGLSLKIGPVTALHDVSFDIPAGKTVALVGESGCGKSLTAKALLKIFPDNAQVTAGRICFSNIDITSLPARSPALARIRGGDIGMIYQEPMTALSVYYTIGNQIEETIRQHARVSRSEARKRALAALEAVGLPATEKQLDAYSFELSGGQRQRAMIAMALSTSPSLLIADEPTTALDVTTQAVILNLLRQLQQERGMSMLFITHDLILMPAIADEVVVMYLGEVVERGPVQLVLESPQHPYTQALLASVPREGQGRLATIPGSVPSLADRPSGCSFANRCNSFTAGKCDQQKISLTANTPGQMVRCLAYSQNVTLKPATSPAAEQKQAEVGEPVLRVNHLYKSFNRSRGLFRRQSPVQAISDVSLQLRQGETLALVGESGSGKTTLARTVIGLLPATAGTVELIQDNRRTLLTTLTDRRMHPVWRKLRMVFQDPFMSLNSRMTVFEIIADPLRNAGEKHPAPHVYAALERVGLDPSLADRYPHAFSGGQRQRIGIARALVTDPDIVILDEPVSALDVSVQAQVLNLLSDLQQQSGLTYLFISHDLNVVARVSHRVAVIYAGRIVECASTKELFAAPRHPYTKALLAARPSLDTSLRWNLPVTTDTPVDPARLPPGCAYAPRCEKRSPLCETTRPVLVDGVACHLFTKSSSTHSAKEH